MDINFLTCLKYRETYPKAQTFQISKFLSVIFFRTNKEQAFSKFGQTNNFLNLQANENSEKIFSKISSNSKRSFFFFKKFRWARERFENKKVKLRANLTKSEKSHIFLSSILNSWKEIFQRKKKFSFFRGHWSVEKKIRSFDFSVIRSIHQKYPLKNFNGSDQALHTRLSYSYSLFYNNFFLSP